jgi:hypothetical protein
MVTYNISPDTVKYLGYRHIGDVPPQSSATYLLDKGVIKNNYYPILIVQDSPREITLEIPDELLQKYLCFTIKKNTKGVIPEQSNLLFDLRKSLKTQMKKFSENSSEYKVLDSRQLATKIANNATYGISGNPNIEVGDLGSAMLTTAFGRELAHFVATYLGDTVIEVDTDGLYFEGDNDIDKINQAITDAVKEKYKGFPFAPILKMEMEVQGYKGLFTGMKTYMLLNPKNGKMKVTGSAFKGSSKAKYVDNIVRVCAEAIFADKDPIAIRKEATEMMRSNVWEPDDFRIHSTIKRELDDYKADGGIQYHIATIDREDDNAPFDRLITAAKTRVTKEFLRLPEESRQNFLKMAQKKARSEEIKGPEDVLQAIAEGYMMVMGYSARDAVRLACIDTAISMTGKLKSSTANMAYKLLMKAREDGIVLMPGESLDFYVAYSPDEREMFTKENLKNFPINYDYYEGVVNSAIDTMLSVLKPQQLVSIF